MPCPRVPTLAFAFLLVAAASLPARAAPPDTSAAVVVTEATDVLDEPLGRFVRAVHRASANTALQMRATPEDAETLLRAAGRKPRSCAAAADCVARLGKALHTRYVLAIGAAGYGVAIAFTVDVVDTVREVVIGHAEGRWLMEGDADPIAADLVVRSLPPQLRNALATLVLEANVDGAMVTLDGERVGRTPLEPVSVAPGDHLVLFEKAGYADYRTRLRTEPGSRARIDATLEELPESAPAEPVRALEPAQPHSHLPIFVAAGGSVAALASGLAFTVQMRATERRYLSECSSALGIDCELQPIGEETPRMKELRASVERQDLVATVSFGVAAAAAVTTAVLLYLDPPEPPEPVRRDDDEHEEASLRLEPRPGGASLMLAGTF